MSLPPAVVNALVASGCTAEQLAAAINAAHEAEEQKKAEAEAARRLKNAEKMRRYRERNRPLPDVTVTDGNEQVRRDTGIPLPPCPPAFPPDPHTTPLNPPIPDPTGGARADAKSTGPPGKGRRLPPDWRPTDDDVTAARAEGLTDEQISRESAKFRDFWIAKSGAGGLKLNWSATWRNWVRRGVDEGRCGPAAGNRGGRPASGPEGGGRQPVSRLAAYASAAHKLDVHG